MNGIMVHLGLKVYLSTRTSEMEFDFLQHTCATLGFKTQVRIITKRRGTIKPEDHLTAFFFLFFTL
jgi:hypothetical protein